MTTAIERLEQLLDDKDVEIEKLRTEASRLKWELEGSLDGWRRAQEPPCDYDNLPVPRLELAYVQLDEWRDFKVIYRLVMRHLNGELIGIPLGCTRTGSSGNHKPESYDLPRRDGCHAAHDGAHLRMPLYKLMPGELPTRLRDDAGNYDDQCRMGTEHRRS